jgi:lipopolysaccharide transport system ATP-binding protein
MSDARTVIRFADVGKMYKIFSSRGDNLVDALGLQRLIPWRTTRFREFWALRGIDFELKEGERLGIIGRNGAGKSTLLKLITGNLAPTEGDIKVIGDVQALLEIGGGLHPEFTGHENIHAALVHLGLSSREIEAAADDIAEFTELGSFLDQPFKTYSLGMQARLSFAIGTAVKPEILIIDEILGAGDAYFFGKSSARMQKLIEGGAAVLLVSHGLDQIVRFCDETIWIDRGRIAMRGPSVEVVKAYEKFIREFDDRRLVAKNRKSRLAQYDAFAREGYTDYVTARVIPDDPSAPVDVAQVALLVNGEREDGVDIGGPQDADSGQSTYVVLDGDAWSGPLQEEDRGRFFRTTATAHADTVFNLWFFYPDAEYAVEVTHRGGGGTLAFGRSGRFDSTLTLVTATEWTTVRLPLVEQDDDWKWHGGGRREMDVAVEEAPDDEGQAEAQDRTEGSPRAVTSSSARPGSTPRSSRVSRWPGEGSLVIEDVAFLDVDGEEQALFRPFTPLTVVVRARAHKRDSFRIQPVAAVFRIDGILISNLVGDNQEVELEEGAPIEFRLTVDELNMGDGRYVVSIALYRELSHNGVSVAYDLLDRSYEFEVAGNHPFHNGVFRHPGEWQMRVPIKRMQPPL